MIRISPRWAEQSVAVVFASDAYYIPYLAVAILSLIEHSSPQNKYDIIILADSAAVAEEERLKQMCAGRDYISVRCIDMSSFKSVCEGFEVRNHLSAAAYYRLYISSICADYRKVLYMDCDVLCHADVAALYHKELGDNLVAAAYDSPIRELDTEWLVGARSYIESIGMKDARQCFNSGVLVMNLEQMRRENTEQELLRVAAINKKYWHDQSVLNICCQNRVLLLPESWNFTMHMYDPVLFSPRSAGECLRLIQEQSYHIIHYAAGKIKPWQTFSSPLYRQWWEVAARTPYFATICSRTMAPLLVPFSFLKKLKLQLVLLLALCCPTASNRKRGRDYLTYYGNLSSTIERWTDLWRAL